MAVADKKIVEESQERWKEFNHNTKDRYGNLKNMFIVTSGKHAGCCYAYTKEELDDQKASGEIAESDFGGVF